MRFDEAYSGKVFIKSHPSFEESEGSYLWDAYGLDSKLPSGISFWPCTYS